MPTKFGRQMYPSPALGDTIRMHYNALLLARTGIHITAPPLPDHFWFNTEIGAVRVDEFEVIG